MATDYNSEDTYAGLYRKIYSYRYPSTMTVPAADFSTITTTGGYGYYVSKVDESSGTVTMEYRNGVLSVSEGEDSPRFNEFGEIAP